MSEPRLDLASSERRRSPWWGEHAARYRFALPYVAGKRVLDVACGTGYGLKLYRDAGADPVGVDADQDAVRKARAELGADENVLVGDGCALPMADGSFDVVTSFETIEHLHDRAAFVRQLRRVLKPEGVCILSTPNANYTQPIEGKPRNPYHVHEYTPEELAAELGAVFGAVELLGQALRPSFKMSPFADDHARLPHTFSARSRLLLWRMLIRLPRSLGDAGARRAWGHNLVPVEEDYEFSYEIVPRAPVLLAVCRCI